MSVKWEDLTPGTYFAYESHQFDAILFGMITDGQGCRNERTIACKHGPEDMEHFLSPVRRRFAYVTPDARLGYKWVRDEYLSHENYMMMIDQGVMSVITYEEYTKVMEGIREVWDSRIISIQQNTSGHNARITDIEREIRYYMRLPSKIYITREVRRTAPVPPSVDEYEGYVRLLHSIEHKNEHKGYYEDTCEMCMCQKLLKEIRSGRR